MAATKLHELLAVETNHENQAGKARVELTKTFKDKRHLFEERIVSFKPNEEGAKETVEEQSSIQSSVHSEIDWIKKLLAKSYDASHQIDLANTMAKADVVLEDGATLLTAVPATSLLRLAHHLEELRELVIAIPTLDPAKGFQVDKDRGKGYYRARQVEKTRTKKVFAPVIMVPASKEHPAQVEKLYEDKPTGMIQAQEWSAMLTPATKSDILEKLDTLSRAVRKARARANEQEVNVDQKIGEKILNYVFQPLEA